VGSLDVFARTLWGEARGEGQTGMEAVACVICNRASHPRKSWGGSEISNVCQQPWQFSCWNRNDPNLPKLMVVTREDPAFATALQVAHRAVSGGLEDITEGSDHYFAVNNPAPNWATHDKFVKRIGNHAFYRIDLPPPRSGSTEVLATDRVRQACEASFPQHHDDCSAFARDVARRLGVKLEGPANDIVKTLRTGQQGWTPLSDGAAAARSAHDGKLVIGGLPGSEQSVPKEHGHVVVVVDGKMAGRYPRAYWGQLGGDGIRGQTVNFAWRPGDRDRVSYAEHRI
jgi:N-acetylmuramoyl-L-alanine amidase